MQIARLVMRRAIMMVRVRPLVTSRREVRGDAHHDHSVDLIAGTSTVYWMVYYYTTQEASVVPHSPLLLTTGEVLTYTIRKSRR
jgi:hypothetical protein